MTHRSTRFLMMAAMSALFAGGALAQPVFTNPLFEEGDSPGSAGISQAVPPDFIEFERTWGPNGEDFLHSAASREGNGGLGNQFAFYSNNNGEAVYQILGGDAIAADTIYEVSFWMNEGGTAQAGEVAGLFIGAVAVGEGEEDPKVGPGLGAFGSTLTDLEAAGFTILASAEFEPNFAWTQETLAMAEGAPSGVVGQQLVVGLYNTQSGHLGFVLGDATGDGKVDTQDIQILISNFDPDATDHTIAEADFNEDGKTDTQDIQIIISEFGNEGSPTAGDIWFDDFSLTVTPIPAVTVPEPASLALLGLGGLLVARRRRA